MTELQTFAELVERMRTAQWRYFRHRTAEALAKAKSLERQVDAAVVNIINVTDRLQPDQPQLFS